LDPIKLIIKIMLNKITLCLLLYSIEEISLKCLDRICLIRLGSNSHNIILIIMNDEEKRLLMN